MSPPMSAPPPPPPAYKFTSKDALKTAVTVFKKDQASAKATYGLIAGWDVSGISDMSYLFYEPTCIVTRYSYTYEAEAALDAFDENISNWDISRVTNMRGMFKVRAGLHLEAPRTPLEHAPYTESSPAQSPPISAPSFPITCPEPGVDS